MTGLTFGSLFSGIGGIDLGLERAGWRCVWQSEVDPYASRVLAKHWPHVPNLGDVTEIDWSTVERPDLVCGGYPCQPFSYAGDRKGSDDPRHLWPHFARALRLLRPRWALLENVPGHLSLGFGDVLADLDAIGYDTEWESLPAAAVGAPHLRWRLFVVAHARRVGVERAAGEAPQRERVRDAAGRGRTTVADPDGRRLEERRQPDSRPDGRGQSPRRDDAGRRSADLADADGAGCAQQRRTLAVFPQHAAPQRCGWWDVEPDVGRVANGIPNRVDRLRGLGNAVVPQVAEWLGRRIKEAA